MQKRIILFSIFTAIIILGLYFTMVKDKTNNGNLSIVKNTSGEIRLSSYNATTTYAVINMSYPESSDEKYPEINSYIKETRSNFERDFALLTQEEIKDMYGRENVQFQLFTNTRLATSSKTTSFIIETYEYTGGAHGGTTVTTFTYDSNGKLVKLNDVLQNNYLSKISALAKDYVYKNFSEYSQPIMIDAGVAPENENFSAWYLTDEKLVFVFQQYQVGPYAMGIQEFSIDRSQISDILSPAYK